MIEPRPRVLRLVLGMLQTNCYLVVCPQTLAAMVIDPADSAELIIRAAQQEGARIEQILLTHAHLDHIAALPALRESTGAKVLGHPGEVDMLAKYLRLFGLRSDQFPALNLDVELRGGEEVAIGRLVARVISTPGHSVGGLSLSLGDSVFTGDALFAQGIGRVDLPGGNLDELLRSIQTLFELPDETTIYPGHGGESTVGTEKTDNPYL